MNTRTRLFFISSFFLLLLSLPRAFVKTNPEHAHYKYVHKVYTRLRGGEKIARSLPTQTHTDRTGYYKPLPYSFFSRSDERKMLILCLSAWQRLLRHSPLASSTSKPHQSENDTARKGKTFREHPRVEQENGFRWHKSLKPRGQLSRGWFWECP